MKLAPEVAELDHNNDIHYPASGARRMKKRSNPIPLISVAGLCLVLIGYMNFRSAPVSPDQAAKAAQPTPPMGNPDAVSAAREAPTAKDIHNSINVGTTPSDTLKPQPHIPVGANMIGSPGHMAPHLPPQEVSHMPVKPQKPKPNDASISSQWYTDDSNNKSGN
jgi:hypothetical protein